MKPLAIDLYCGLGGWADGLLAEGFRVIGFDIERHVYGEHRYPAPLVLQDVLTLDGRQLREAALIVASPPCQEPSYRAMPWSRAKALNAAGPPERFIALFDACFRIQREACEAAGRHIPLVVENVRGAQPWVGRARWNFGSFYLWGDVPALMPLIAGRKNNGGSWFAIGGPGQKVVRQNPDGRNQEAIPVTDGRKIGKHGVFGPGGIQQKALEGIKGVPHRTAGHWTNPAKHEGLKQPGINLSDVGFNVANARQFAHMVEGVKIERSEQDKRQHIGTSRKFASAMIAKIPEPLSRHIAATYYPR